MAGMDSERVKHPLLDSGDPMLGERWGSDPRFRAAFDNAPIGMALVDPSGVLSTANEAFCQMLGYERHELVGRAFPDLTHPDDVEASHREVQKLAEGKAQAVQLVKRYLHKQGHSIWARVSVAAIRGTSGEVLEHVAQMEDITGWRQAEASAAASEEKFRLAFDSAASGMALVDPTDGRFVRVNPAGRRMLGYTEEELTTLTIQDVTAPEDREESLARFRRVISGEQSFSQSKLHYMRADGSTAYAIVSTALVEDAMGRPLHLVANVVDITEQIQAQDQLEAMVASKDELIASVSHELRTPLTAILGFSEMLKGESSDLDAGERLELIQAIAAQTTDLANIVEDLLVAARADTQSLTVVRVPVDLRAQTAQVLETLGHDYNAHTVSLPPTTKRGLGDPGRVRQILRNLITNAFRYGGDQVEVASYEKQGWVCLAVLDDGPGIPEEARESIFEPYQRAPNSEGLAASIGLGLTVSRKLARLMEGDLTYRHEEGRSVFELVLEPLSEDG